MKSIQSLFIAGLLFFSFTSCSTLTSSSGPSSFQEVPFLGNQKAYRYRFPNGLKLVVIEDHSSPTFAYQTWFNVGSRNEKVNYTGLAHLFEHMMFKQTKNTAEGEFDKTLEKLGAEGLNAFTSRDYTAYIQELPKEHLETLMKYESDRMTNLIVNQKSFETEREVVQNERRFRNENSPEGMMFQEVYTLAYQKSNYRWPVIGYEQDLKRMTAVDAEHFYKEFYSPNRATIVIVGDVNHKNISQLVQKYYGSLVSAPESPPKTTIEPIQTEARRKQIKLNIQVEKLMMAYVIPSLNHSHYPALTVLQNILGGGKSSRLYKALVNTGIANSVNVYAMDGVESSLFLIMANLQSGKKASDAETVILKEIKNLSKNYVQTKELEGAKNRVLFDLYESIDSSSEKARLIGSYETTSGGFEKFQEQLKDIEKTNAEKIKNMTNVYLKPELRSILIGVKK